jgi:Cu+-exporting ATPase
VYTLLSENGLLDFYNYNEDAGISQRSKHRSDYSHLDEPVVAEKIYLFNDGQVASVKLHLPAIHCSSCLWLLENLNRLNPAIRRSSVMFGIKEAHITFRTSEVSLRELAELLERIGYPPALNRTSGDQKGPDRMDKQLLIRIGVVGFLFGNIMLMSFPEYLTHDEDILGQHGRSFAWINLALSIPVILVGARDYFFSALRGVRSGRLNIDVPIAIGVSVIFLRSLFEILTSSGPGYLDSMAGLIFFLLVGKWYQSRLHQQLSFDHDHRSYFPLAVTKLVGGSEESILIGGLRNGDRIRVKTGELIPADSRLQSPEATIDNSFITGESVEKHYALADRVFAGARNVGTVIDLEVEKEVDQSYLTSLWNAPAFSKSTDDHRSWIDRAAAYFTPSILLISVATLVYWNFADPGRMWNAFTAVLIIACPCALALTVPFTLGHARYILGRVGFFARNVSTLERIAELSDLVFDKTGTLTKSDVGVVEFVGPALSTSRMEAVNAVVSQSNHPNSRAIAAIMPDGGDSVTGFKEVPGLGVEGQYSGFHIRIGNGAFVGADGNAGTYLSINGEVIGYFRIGKELRPEVPGLINQLQSKYTLHLLSGDNREQEKEMTAILGPKTVLRFEQKPDDKMGYIQGLQNAGHLVGMIGDGLNDAGAFKQSDVGIAVVEDIHGFSPACDVIMRADRMGLLNNVLSYVHRCRSVVRAAVTLSLLYNMVGIFFAAQGLLSPVIAAVLMPLSSISIIVLGTAGSYLMARKSGLLQPSVMEQKHQRMMPDQAHQPVLG